VSRKPKPNAHRTRREGESWEEFQQRQYEDRIRDLARHKAKVRAAKAKSKKKGASNYTTSMECRPQLYPVRQHPDRPVSGGLPSLGKRR
jgi:hypothetical protein